jgi:hypothetical protein
MSSLTSLFGGAEETGLFANFENCINNLAIKVLLLPN